MVFIVSYVACIEFYVPTQATIKYLSKSPRSHFPLPLHIPLPSHRLFPRAAAGPVLWAGCTSRCRSGSQWSPVRGTYAIMFHNYPETRNVRTSKEYFQKKVYTRTSAAGRDKIPRNPEKLSSNLWKSWLFSFLGQKLFTFIRKEVWTYPDGVFSCPSSSWLKSNIFPWAIYVQF